MQRSRGMQGGDSSNRTSRAGSPSVRRPLRGIEIKEDTYAIMKVVQANGEEIPLLDSSSGDGLSSLGYSNFMLQSVQESRAEKAQIVQTFGDNYVFFFGEDPRFLECQAVLVNTHDFNWRAEWWENYNRYLRGSKLAEMGARLYLFYDDIVVEGYLMGCSATETSAAPYSIQMQFRLFVTNYQNISFVGNPEFPVRSSVVLPDSVDLTTGDAGARLSAAYRGQALDLAELENFDRQAQAANNSGALTQEGEEPTTFGPFEVSSQASDGNAQATIGLPPGPQPVTSQNPLASGSRITKLIQSAPASFAVSQNIWDFLFTTATFEEATAASRLILRSGSPIRGLIADNADEFTGGVDSRTNLGYEAGELRPPSAYKGTIRSELEVEDLFRETIQFLSCYGANVDDPQLMISLGLGPNFKPQVNVSDGGTFNPTGDPTSLGDFLSNVEDRTNSVAEGLTSSFDSFQSDPLGSIFGRPQSNSDFGPNKPKYTEGAGDPLYGYPSDFAEGQPGFGIPGFGDLGGKGFGSALGENGDPGFKDPSKFTFAGVTNNQGAFDRFTAPKEDPTALTASGSIGGTLSGGAGVSVNGKPSAFSVISVPGLLDAEGQARQKADAIAEKQAQQRFGFSQDNPFGVSCPEPESQGLNYTYP